MLNEKDAEFAWELSRRLKLDDNKRKKANRLRVAAGLSDDSVRKAQQPYECRCIKRLTVNSMERRVR